MTKSPSIRQDEFAGDLNGQGYTDVLVLRRENRRDVLTESRLTLVRHLERYGNDVESVSALARRLDRDKGAVSKYLRRLTELDIIKYEGEGDGESKRPVLKHECVVIEPVVYWLYVQAPDALEEKEWEVEVNQSEHS